MMEMDRARVSRIAAKLRLVMPKTNSNEFRGWRRSVEAFRDTGIPGGLVELFDELSGYGEYARVGVGENISTDAALAIGEHAFRAGFEAARIASEDYYGRSSLIDATDLEKAWSDYNPPEDIKALTGELSGEPVAWAYELAGWKDMNTGEVGGWEKRVRFVKPNAPADAIRNLRALR